MMNRFLLLQALALTLLVVAPGVAGPEQRELRVDGKAVLSYQSRPMSHPKGGDRFKGSNFIHPLKTPAGFVVTDLQPEDHLHHFGLWWPWKYIQTEGRKVLCWELQRGDGIIEARASQATRSGFTAQSVYIDRKAPGGPDSLLNETLHVSISEVVALPAPGYFVDLKIVHAVAGDTPLTISKYRYSGFALRGSAVWNTNNSTVLTSEGHAYSDANTTRARWVRIEGATAHDATAGVIMMSHPGNHTHPEKLRTWGPRMHNGAIFINFNTVQDTSWLFEPGKSYTRRYRLFIYDGAVPAAQAEACWKAYSASEVR
ncbi:MAG: PmoA family protein [Verrucomicrobia bacterium]|jgi:hypothetical protein|nr:PmoA family protein [Verrucomicrobiota bacterium]MBT7065209.1 PmoA family protein [Verrucomicrobiota bacterium]MBT7700901.1 PmoA family protein [Verrucomicrobiota bacterium]